MSMHKIFFYETTGKQKKISPDQVIVKKRHVLYFNTIKLLILCIYIPYNGFYKTNVYYLHLKDQLLFRKRKKKLKPKKNTLLLYNISLIILLIIFISVIQIQFIKIDLFVPVVRFSIGLQINLHEKIMKKKKYILFYL
ncbi:hypothetical protein PFAG_01116 [Plasmodium falciparum Santa Lucia]|uniref:Uncharacterized protein n=1 Tax=Plasmodium falciparum Santa Lucia TaxID=478859 RepID=W7FNP8_PLAFA|nr:hypothetical protein PFAG_01116 [Plasmodium falciparum Santa Lucia]